jgi:hypothetical protein
VIAACRKVILSKMHLGLDDGKLIAEMAQSVILSTVMLDFGGSVPVIKVGNGVMEGVVGGGGAVEQSVEPDRDGLGDVLR